MLSPTNVTISRDVFVDTVDESYCSSDIVFDGEFVNEGGGEVTFNFMTIEDIKSLRGYLDELIDNYENNYQQYDHENNIAE